MRRACFIALLALTPLAGLAEVVDSSAGGFTSRNSAQVAAAPLEVFAKLVQGVGVWWHPDHTYSGDSANLRIEPRLGGCFCESLPNGGFVEHLRVVYVDPGRTLRLAGGLGPLQSTGATGALTWELKESDGGTEIELTYAVGGYVPGGLDSWAAGVDRVVGEQLERLTRFVESGRPEGEVEPSPGDGGSG